MVAGRHVDFLETERFAINLPSMKIQFWNETSCLYLACRDRAYAMPVQVFDKDRGRLPS